MSCTHNHLFLHQNQHCIDFGVNGEMFREKLTAVCQKENYTKGGRSPIDVIIKFKASILRRLYNLSYDLQTAHIPAEKLQKIYPMAVRTRSAKRVKGIIR